MVETATDVMSEIQSIAEAIKSDAPQRFPEAASFGEDVRQGDIYIVKLESVPRNFTEVKAEKQLAVGNTQGSRHCLDSLDGITMYRNKDADQFTGPVFVSSCERTITHPEHGDRILPPGVYLIGYQRNLDEMDRAMRAKD